MRHLAAPIIVATRTTLGTINHTLLTLLAIRQAKLPVRGVVMIGKENVDNRLAIERYGDVPVIGSIPWLETIDRQTLRRVFEQHFDRNTL
jgi:dethiobiotin synthetase